jgi:hypothetical protein
MRVVIAGQEIFVGGCYLFGTAITTCAIKATKPV